MSVFEKIKAIDINPFFTSQKQGEKWLAQYNGIYFEITKNIADLLFTIQKSNSLNEGIACFVVSKNNKYSIAEINAVLKKNIYPIFYAKSQNSFLIKKDILSADKLSSLSNYFKFLFKKPIFYVFFGTSILINSIFYFIAYSKVTAGSFDIYTLLLLLLFFIFSSFFHELGHASATKYYDIGHGSVGFALYWNFPVFYTDVSKIWELPPKKRCIVNLGGVYFQSILLIPILILFFITQNELLKYIIILTNINMLITLNPFFKFDGYWLISDICGVANLRKRLNEFLIYLVNKLRKKQVSRPYLLKLKNPQRSVLLVYFVISNLFMGFYFLYLLPKLLYTFFQEYPERLEMFFMELSSGILPTFKDVQYLFVQTIFIVFIGYMIYLIFSKIRKKMT